MKIVRVEIFLSAEFMDEVDVPSSIQGYHVNKKMWTLLGEERLSSITDKQEI